MTQKYEHGIGLFRKFAGVRDLLVAARLPRLIALREPDAFKTAVRLQALVKLARGIAVGMSDDRDAASLFQRQNALVFQKDGALFRRTESEILLRLCACLRL